MNNIFHFSGPISVFTMQNLRGCILDAMRPGNAQKLMLFMSSEGGDVTAGIAMYNFLRSMPVPVETYNFGAIESVAVFVYLAGNKRYTLPDARFLVHGFTRNYASPSQPYPAIRESIVSLDSHSNICLNIFEERTSGAKAKIDIKNNLLGEARILTPAESIPAGIARRIVSPEEISSISGTHWNVNVSG